MGTYSIGTQYLSNYATYVDRELLPTCGCYLNTSMDLN